jgi:hypothetical protein
MFSCHSRKKVSLNGFDVVGRDDENEAWKYRYLLDMDGHAYSGRFYAFAVLVEWHVVDPGEENVLVPFSEKGQLERNALAIQKGQDCSDEKMFFDVVGRDDENEAWKYRYLLDMDGHEMGVEVSADLRLIRPTNFPSVVTPNAACGLCHAFQDGMSQFEKMFFDVVGRDDENEAWKYRYLLDMDGHAYSGRFWALKYPLTCV